MNRPPHFHITVATVLQQNGRFLLVEEKIADQLVINQPAGHVEPLEFPVAASCRETLEETGWHYQPRFIIGIYYYSPHPLLTYQRICFGGELLQQVENAVIDPVISRQLWLTRDEILHERERLRSPMVLQCIDDYLAGKRYDLSLLKNFSDQSHHAE